MADACFRKKPIFSSKGSHLFEILDYLANKLPKYWRDKSSRDFKFAIIVKKMTG